MKNVIIGTAGHVDHGKTEIVKALTGKDTDRLSEEKSRGISIVLGFAPIDLGVGIRAGIIDVPGHEKFIKNMVSGVVGVDLVIFVIAADEGVMPQTREHFEIVRMLGVNAGIIVITKMDLADSELARIVESEAKDLLKNTPLENSPFVHTSTVSGEGLDELKRILADKCKQITEKKDNGFFRIPVDRVFSKTGIGTIVTGTTWSGKTYPGDELVLEPLGRKVRVREIQTFDTSLEETSIGMRIALALHGVKQNDVSIGDQLLTPGKLKVTSMLNTSVEVSMIPGSAIKNRQRLRFHHAAREIMCRAVLLDNNKLDKGLAGFIQLRLEKPTVAMAGDRFVLRTYSPMRVVGGGIILDPLPAKVRGSNEKVIKELNVLKEGSEKEIVKMLIDRAGEKGILLNSIERFGFTAEGVVRLVGKLERSGDIRRIGRVLVSSANAETKENEIMSALEQFGKRNSLMWGMDKEELRVKIGLEGNSLFDFLMKKGETEGRLFFKGGLVRSGSANRALSKEEQNVLRKVEKIILEKGFEFSLLKDLVEEYGQKTLDGYLHILRERKVVVKIKKTGYMHTEYMDKILKGVKDFLAGGSELTIGELKNMFGFSRKFAVPLLEYLDSERYTRRVGNARVAGPRLEERDGN
ncbi:selenocysteine-specific translation elongation factor [bacterium]|nr:selenocysteine-specific translation elongation factor [bacterium]